MSTLPLFDSHSHINADAFDGDRDAVIAAMKAQGLVGAMVVSCEEKEYAPLMALLAQHPGYLWGAWALHPEYESDWEPSVEEIVERCSPEAIRAVGETGLDFYWCPTRPQWQFDRFERHIEAAKRLHKPLIIHARDAEDEALEILAEHEGVPFVMHCFSGSLEAAQKTVRLGGMVSFTGNITFKKNDELREISKAVPLEHLMLETDCPYMAPVPFRGKRCDPTMVAPIAQVHADLRGLRYEDVARATTANAQRFFQLPA